MAMRILLTNDDGIYSLGLCALYEALVEDGHQVTVVAPEAERSAVGHAITLTDPIRVKRITRAGDEFGWAINGTPADCVKLGINALLNHKPDMIVSGINLGANAGINVLYSGTVSAATEAAIMGIKAIAVSIDTFTDPEFCMAAFYVKDLANWFHNEPSNCLALNVNIPSLPANRIAGIKVTGQNTQCFIERFEKREDPRGNIYFWQCTSSIQDIQNEDNDLSWLQKGYITITPLKFDLTHKSCLENIRPPLLN